MKHRTKDGCPSCNHQLYDVEEPEFNSIARVTTRCSCPNCGAEWTEDATIAISPTGEKTFRHSRTVTNPGRRYRLDGTTIDRDLP